MRLKSYQRRSLSWSIKQVATNIIPFVGILGLLFPDQFKIGPTERVPWVVGVIATWFLCAVASAWADKAADQTDPGLLAEDEFLRQYVLALRDAVAFLPLISLSDETQLQKAIEIQLRNICTIAEAFKNDDKDHRHSFNCCLYVAVPAEALSQSQLQAAARFKDPGRNTYKYYLILQNWAYIGIEPLDENNPNGEKRQAPCDEVGFILPVDDDEQYTLLGAPYCFKTGKQYAVADVTNEKQLRNEKGLVHRPLANEVIGHFRNRRSYRSFVNLPVEHGTERVGAISLQSQQKKACGLAKKTDQSMYHSLEPFLDILGILMVESDRRGKNKQTNNLLGEHHGA